MLVASQEQKFGVVVNGSLNVVESIALVALVISFFIALASLFDLRGKDRRRRLLQLTTGVVVVVGGALLFARVYGFAAI